MKSPWIRESLRLLGIPAKLGEKVTLLITSEGGTGRKGICAERLLGTGKVSHECRICTLFQGIYG